MRPSPVIGFAADGFPIYGTIFRDKDGKIRRARSGYALKTTQRPSPPNGPGGMPDGTYLEDYKFTGKGDLDECNGRTGVTPEYPEGGYHYFITDTFPYQPRCLKGTPDSSFRLGPP